MALQQPILFPNVAAAAAALSSNSSGKFVHLQRWRAKNRVLSSGFCDQGHLQYYKSSFDSAAATLKGVKSGKEKSVKKMKKKQLKLLKGLSRDLSVFAKMGFGLDCNGTLLDHIDGNMITEATQLLLEQLQKVKAEEKEAKKRMKEEKARVKAGARAQMGANCEMSSSSSSSESSDSECGEAVDMSRAKGETLPIIPTIPHSSFITDAAPAPVSPSKKIEVCMGGKCKKSGAGALLDELKRVVGIEDAVSGCKCMGKCRDGPNVKLVGPAAANTLCIGVGLEDVNVIMAKFIDDHHKTGFLK